MDNVQIKHIDIENFRCLQKIHLSFEESPIICLSAGNDCGKSSAVKAIQSLIYNDNERESKGFIRDNTRAFRIAITFTDGTCIYRERGVAGNIYRMIDSNQNIICEHKKLDSGEVPPEIQNFLNVFVDEATGELLNIRTCESLILFALTKGSDNYKVVHNALKVETISKAIEFGNNNISALNSSIRKSENIKDGNLMQLSNLVVQNTEALEKLQERISESYSNLSKIKGLLDVMDKAENLRGALDSVDASYMALEEIPINSVGTIERLSKLCEDIKRIQSINSEIERIGCVDNLSEIDISHVNVLNNFDKLIDWNAKINDLKLLIEIYDSNLIECSNSISETIIDEFSRIENLLESIEKIKEFIDSTASLSGLGTIDSSILLKFDALFEANKSINECGNKLRIAEEELQMIEESMREAIRELSDGLWYDAESNAIIRECPSCGSEVVFSFDAIVRACEAIA